jgi:ferredoxin, 2Fe-2S
MPKIEIRPHPELCSEGRVLQVESGRSLCQLFLDEGIAIEHACDMSCACTTCHVLIREGMSSLEPATEDEEDMLDKAWGVSSASRLSCQIKVGQSRYTINHARENH